jgi:hypothetical protein
MEKTDAGTPVGVDDPYDHVGHCDHLTDDGRCRYAVEHGDHDPGFARERRRDDYRCPVVADPDGSPEPPRASGPEAPESDRDGRAGAASEEGGPGAALPGPWEWVDCPHFRCRDRTRECVRCGLEAVRMAHDDDRPLLEEHHLSYDRDGDRAPEPGTADPGPGCDPAGGADGRLPAHEITVYLCRWCHAKVHDSWARIDDDVAPDAEAIAEREGRRSRERDELGFDSAADRFDSE